MDNIIKAAKGGMEKAVVAFKAELASIRTGRANAGILDGIKVEYYGTLTPLNQVATINTPDAKMITVQPWEAKIIPDIEKAILKADIGLTPGNDGKIIRLPIPTLTEERRRDYVKIVKKQAEEGRVAVRMARREANDAVKKLHDAKDISDDDFKKSQTDIQKTTDDYIAKVDQLAEHKEKDIMSV